MDRTMRRLIAGAVALAATCIVALTASSASAADAPPSSAPEASLPPAALKAMRAATFEVVLRKPDKDDLRYERALPFDQLPFSVRNDKYESIGTAFVIAPGRFVTAAHVTGVAQGSLWGVPAIRDAQGHVYPIDKVVKFSLHEDFIVFTVSNPPAVTPLPTTQAYEFDTPVHAVGNALGQGIITRDGALTSETPEDQDGRWKWLRFSAPASPGNSGGPLLDAQGRVIGLISRKSPNENLNFALPIARVIEAPQMATMDVRYTVALPFLAAHRQTTLKATFDLPLPFPEFDRRLMAATNEHAENAQKALLAESAAELFPRGKSGKVLTDPFFTSQPAFVTQQSDGTWDGPRKNGGNTKAIGGDGYVWTDGQPGAAVFHVHYPSELDVQKSRGDSQLLGEQLLKALPLSRTVGSEHVHIESLGSAAKAGEWRDAEGRSWQLWQYRLLFSDTTLTVMALPVPDGYVGFARSSGQGVLERVVMELKGMTDYFQTPYTGSLPRWRAFLAETRVRPDAFAQWHAALDPSGEVTLALPRVSIAVNRDVLPLSDQSVLIVIPGMIAEADRFTWDVVAARFGLEAVNSAALQVVRRPHPSEDAGDGATRRWNNMVQGTGGFSGKPMRDPQSFWVARATAASGVAVGEAKFLYDVSYLTPMIRVPGEVPRAAPHLLEMVSVREQ
jgi:serine protease Do